MRLKLWKGSLGFFKLYLTYVSSSMDLKYIPLEPLKCPQSTLNVYKTFPQGDLVFWHLITRRGVFFSDMTSELISNTTGWLLLIFKAKEDCPGLKVRFQRLEKVGDPRDVLL